MSAHVMVSNPLVDDDHKGLLFVHHGPLSKTLPRYSHECGQRERTSTLPISQWKLFNGQFSKQQFVNWLLDIEKYFHDFKVSKVEGAKYIYHTFTPSVQLLKNIIMRTSVKLCLA